MMAARVLLTLCGLALVSSCLFDLPEGRETGCAGETLACYDGPEGTRGVGACRDGTAACSPAGDASCVGAVLPALEDCSTEVDESCDGTGCTGTTRFVRSFGSGSDQAIHAVTFSRDALFVAGSFAGTFAGVTSAGGLDGFVARLDPANGEPIWVHRFGGAEDDGLVHGRSIAAMPDGGVVIAAVVDGVREAGDLVRVNGSLHLLRLDPSGAETFARTFPSSVYRPSISARPDGRFFVASLLEGTIDLGGGTIDGGANPAALIAGFEGDGTLVFGRALGSEERALPNGIAVRPDGTVTVVGELDTSLELAPDLPSIEAETDEGAIAFVVDLSEAGTLLRARRFDTVDRPHAERPQVVMVDGTGTTWLGGYFRGALSIDGTRIDSSDDGDDDGFIAALDPGLRVAALHRYGDASGYQVAWGLDVDALGQPVVVGNLNGTPTLGPTAMLIAYEDAEQSADAFAVKLTHAGEVTWLASLRGPRFQRALATGIGPLGEVVVGGLFEGDIVLPYTPVTTTGVPHAFVARFDP